MPDFIIMARSGVQGQWPLDDGDSLVVIKWGNEKTARTPTPDEYRMFLGYPKTTAEVQDAGQ